MATDTLRVLAPHDGGTCDTNLWVALTAAVLLDVFLLHQYVLVPRWKGAQRHKERAQTEASRYAMRKARSPHAAMVDSAAPPLATWNLSMPILRPHASSRENSKPNPSIRDQRRMSLPTSLAKLTRNSLDPRRSSKPKVLTSSEKRVLEALSRGRCGNAHTPIGARQELSLGVSSTQLVPVSSQHLPPPRVVSTQLVSSQRLPPPRVSTAAPIQDQGRASLPTSMAKPTPRSPDPRRSSKPSVQASSKIRALEALCREDRRSGGPFKADIAFYTSLGVQQALPLGSSSSSVIVPLVLSSSMRLPQPGVVNTQSVPSQCLPPPHVSTAAPIKDQHPVSLSTSMVKPTPRSSVLTEDKAANPSLNHHLHSLSFRRLSFRRARILFSEASIAPDTPLTPRGVRTGPHFPRMSSGTRFYTSVINQNMRCTDPLSRAVRDGKSFRRHEEKRSVMGDGIFIMGDELADRLSRRTQQLGTFW
jgi:hypothetical protein